MARDKTKYMTVSASAISRSNGHRAVSAAAYRSGTRLQDEKYQCVPDYRAKGGVVHSEIALPADAPAWMKNREKLWNAVEAREDRQNNRKTAQLAKEFLCILPRELNEQQQKEAMREWVSGLAKRGLVVDWSLHVADASDGSKNPHAHCLVATRDIDPKDAYGFGLKWSGDPAIPTSGRKKSPLDDAKTLERFKEEYTETINRYLAESGSEVRITHLSNEARGLDAIPGVHKGKNATALEKKGQETQLADHNRKIGYGNFMKKYDKAAEEAPNHWLAPSAFDSEEWHRRVANWQLQRGAAMAARDAAQRSQSNVATPPSTRSERRTERTRQEALLSYQQSKTYQDRTNASRSDDPDRSR